VQIHILAYIYSIAVSILIFSRTLENRANSNDEICTTNTQDNSENQSNENSGDDTNVQENKSQSRRNSLIKTRITCKQEKFLAQLQELSMSTKGEKAENVVDDDEDAASQSLA
jgi:hypothetical protein